jgi:hypothetical protein
MSPPFVIEHEKHNIPIAGIWENIPDSEKVFGNMSVAATILVGCEQQHWGMLRISPHWGVAPIFRQTRADVRC